MATWTGSTKSADPTYTNSNVNQSTYTNTGKDGEYEYLLQEEDVSLTDFILTEESDMILLEEIYGDNLQNWTNQTEN